MIKKFELRVLFYVCPTTVRVRYKWRMESTTSLVDFMIPIRIDPTKWSAETMRCKNNSYHYGVSSSELNKEIGRYETAGREVFEGYISANVSPTVEEFRDAVATALGREVSARREPLAVDVIDMFIKAEGPRWSLSTTKKFRTLRAFLLAWRPTLTLADVDKGFLDAYVLRHFELGFRNTTIKKNFTLLKWFLRWAVQNEFATCTAHEGYRVKLKGADGSLHTIVYLTWEELIKVYEYDFSGSVELDRVRDVFCFCCFTSLRYSDVASLQWCDVGADALRIVTQKTSEPLVIELNKYSRAILDKYRDGRHKEYFADIRKKGALPVISNQKMNKNLKNIGKAVGLDAMVKQVYFVGSERREEIAHKWEVLTTHCGRRTFIVNAIYLGIPAEVVMKWTGHADYKSMKPYIAITDKLKEASMSKFDEK